MARVVDALVLKLRKLLPKKLEPVPTWMVPLTQRLEVYVEVALVPEPVTSRKPWMVEVAVVEVAVKVLRVRVPKRVEVPTAKLATLLIARSEPGEVVPMPTFPFLSRIKLVAVDDPITKLA